MAILEFDFLSMLVLIGISQGLFLAAIFFFYPRGNRQANRIMTGLILCFCLSILYGGIIHTRIYLAAPHLLRIGVPFQLLFGPLLFFYTRAHMNPRERFALKDLFHIIPFLAAVVIMIPYYRLSGDQKIYFVSNLEELIQIFPVLWLDIIIQILLFCYFIVIFRKLRQHEVNLRENFSNMQGRTFSWIKSLLIQLVFIYIFVSLLMVFKALFQWRILEDFTFQTSRIIPVMVSFFFYFAGYRALTQPAIFLHTPKKDSDIKKNQQVSPAVIDYMDEEKPYLKPDLTLQELAEMLKMSRNQLSAMINHGTGRNFYDFINTYRVEHFKRELFKAGNNHLSILGIALNCGFNSKTTFNKVFKSQTGLTPSLYKKKNQKEV